MRPRFFLKRIALCAISPFALLMASTALADSPTTYNAHTDLNYYNNPYPALPNWGGSTGATNTIIKDPAFGCPIIRVTNANTSSRNVGKSNSTPDSSECRNWSINSDYFHLSDAGGNFMAFTFNTATDVVTPVASPNFYVPKLTDFDTTTDALCYGIGSPAFGQTDNTTLISYNFSTQAITSIVDVKTLANVPAGIPDRLSGDMHISRVGKVASIICGGTAQDTDFVVVSYDIATGVSHVLNLQPAGGGNPTIDGVAFTGSLGLPTAPKLHNASISMGGRYICCDGIAGQGSFILFWDVAASNLYMMTTENGGHKVLGYDLNGKDAFANAGPNHHTPSPNNSTSLLRNITPTAINSPYDLMEHPATDPQRFDASGLSYDDHKSWNNSRNTGGARPVFSDTYHVAGDTGDPHCVWGDEITAIGTSATPVNNIANNTVYRFAQHRSTQNLYSGAANFNDTPRGNVSQDGMYYMFNSNYEDSLGTDPSGKFRVDVFIVHLDQSASN